MKTSRSSGFLIAVLALAAATACRPSEQKTESVNPENVAQARENLPAAVVAEIDSANEAFRAGDHQSALEHYTRAKDMKGDVGAAWFGIYMAQRALGNEDAAKEALAEAQKVSPGATLIHPTARDTTP
ncbi:MAG: tetratricopeptide repeat protein [Gemmatimonadetes bacterium]|nr:tetratricopeptide repeat protein [Gemmatimonadota bacterium]